MGDAIVALALMGSWLLFLGLGAYVAGVKGRPVAEGLVLAALFGPLGCLIAALLPGVGPRARPSSPSPATAAPPPGVGESPRRTRGPVEPRVVERTIRKLDEQQRRDDRRRARRAQARRDLGRD